jgi:alpha-L-fucosidase
LTGEADPAIVKGLPSAGPDGPSTRETPDMRPLILLTLLALTVQASARAEAPARHTWFADAKLGLSVSWGIHSLVGKGEWVMERDKLPIDEYEKLPTRFAARAFHADDWAKAAKGAGARYLIVTAKGHDGFCLFDTKGTNYDAVDATPFAKDPLKPLAEACRGQGIKLVLRYSLLDWHHPDYFPRGKTGRDTHRPETGEWSRYVTYYQDQIRELCTNYGEIGGLWLDGVWDRPDAPWDLAKTYEIIHTLQPKALIANNHHRPLGAGEDVQIVDVSLADTPAVEVDPALPSETATPVERSSGFGGRDRDLKATETLIHALLRASARGSNLALTLAARPDGSLDPDAVERLRDLGAWLDKNGQSVYATTRGPIEPAAWGVSTEKGVTIYLHVTNPRVPVVIPKRLETSTFTTLAGEKLVTHPTPQGIRIEIPETAKTPIDTILLVRPIVFIPDIPARKR